MEIRRDLLKTLENERTRFNAHLDEANKIYYGLLNLIITLSSSSLLISIALVEKLFPAVDKQKFILPNLLIVSWILLSISIVFGIIAELNAAVFHGNLAKDSEKSIKELKKKVSEGTTIDIYKEDDNKSYIISNTIIWGAVSIDAYIIALLFMCVVLLERNFSSFPWSWIIFLVIVFVTLINIILIRQRNKVTK